MSHFDSSVGLVEVEHHHSSAILQLYRGHVDGREHVLQGDLHQFDLGRGVHIPEVVEDDLVVEKRCSSDVEEDGTWTLTHDRLSITAVISKITAVVISTSSTAV